MSGRIDKQIASEMGISLGTVRVYWKRIRMKVGGTRSEVIAELARTSLKLDFEGQQGKAAMLERELEESMVRERGLRVYESAFESLPTPVAILDGPTGRIVHANAAFAALHGYAPEELTDRSSTDLMAGETASVEAQATKAAKEGKHFEAPSTRRRKDGTIFDARLVLSGGDGSWVLALAT